MSKELIVSATCLETRLAILEDDQVTEIFIERAKNKGMLGNIYKGRVTRVLPGMQAAFVDVGLDRHAFLYVSDFLEDYEEYEELFAEAEEKAEELLRTESAGGEDTSRPRRPRRSRRERAKRKRQLAEAMAVDAEEGGEEGVPALPAGSGAEAVQPPPEREPAKSGRAAARPRASRQERPRPAPPATESLASGAIEPVAGSIPSHGGSILPERLPLGDAVSPEARPLAVEEEGDFPQEAVQPPPDTGILPERLETVVTYEPEDPGDRPLEDRQARVDSGDGVKRLAIRAESRSRRRRTAPSRGNGRALIGDLLREGQEILVQVAKEPIGKKGARITSHVVLPGRFLVFMPTVDHVGVSRKIESESERQRLRDIILRLRGDSSLGFIVRTAGEGRSENDFRSDVLYLTRLWDDVRNRAEKISAPGLVHAEPSLTERVIRDYLSEDFRTLRVDDEQEYGRIVEFVNQVMPEMVGRVRLYSKSTPIFDQYGISAEIEKALKPKVWLKNGGYIVLNQTEALVAIDVNTGKFVGRTNSLEDTITRTNLDAVKEVVRQIRLRDLGGIIVIDFIDMDERRNRQKVMEALQQELSKDKAPSKILQFNEFGLVAITRKRVKQSLERTLCQPCVFCEGTGMTKSVRTVCYGIHQEVRKVLSHLGEGYELLIRCHPDVGQALRDGERQVLVEIEEMTRKTVTLKTDPLMHIEQFQVIEI